TGQPCALEIARGAHDNVSPRLGQQSRKSQRERSLCLYGLIALGHNDLRLPCVFARPRGPDGTANLARCIGAAARHGLWIRWRRARRQIDNAARTTTRATAMAIHSGGTSRRYAAKARPTMQTTTASTKMRGATLGLLDRGQCDAVRRTASTSSSRTRTPHCVSAPAMVPMVRGSAYSTAPPRAFLSVRVSARRRSGDRAGGGAVGSPARATTSRMRGAVPAEAIPII